MPRTPSPSVATFPRPPECLPASSSPSVAPASLFSDATAVPMIRVCKSCGDRDFVEMDNGKRMRWIKELSGAEVILSVMRKQDLTVGKFCTIIFASNRRAELSPQSRSQISLFLAGMTEDTPGAVVRAMSKHPFGRTTVKGRVMQPSFVLPAYSIPPLTSAVWTEALGASLPGAATALPAYEAIRQFCVEETLAHVEMEMTAFSSLAELRSSDDDGLTWRFLTAFSSTSILLLVMTHAPCLWRHLDSTKQL